MNASTISSAAEPSSIRPAPLLLATRSPDKAREIRQILTPQLQREIVTIADLALPESSDEADLEGHDTFRANAIAKADYFHKLTRYDVLSDDSGIMVDSLGGQPGVRSKRFCSRSDLTGVALDNANNQLLLQRLTSHPVERRTARYVCAAVLLQRGEPTMTALGSVSGRIAEVPTGRAGFGYDPLFYVPYLRRTFGELDALTKHRFSHRGRAFRALAALCPHRFAASSPIRG